jgi:hypothetical protein
MLMLEVDDLGWRYWLATALALSTASLLGGAAFLLVIAVSLAHLCHFALRQRSLSAFPVQIRLAFLGFVLLAYPEGWQWLYWLPLCGVWVRVLFGYCLLARTLSLLPVNRRVPLTLDYLKRAFLTPPVRGSILAALPGR